jgi:hypothetical protein
MAGMGAGIGTTGAGIGTTGAGIGTTVARTSAPGDGRGI